MLDREAVIEKLAAKVAELPEGSQEREAVLLRIEAHKSALILRYKYGKSADPVKLAELRKRFG